MPRLCANLTMLFDEHPFLERFAAASKAGFRYVEYMFPYDYDAKELQDLLAQNQLQQVLFNLPAGNWGAGDRGIAVDPARKGEFREGVARAREYARHLGAKLINCLVGKEVDTASAGDQWSTMVENLGYAAAELEKDGITLLVEAINTFDIPGFALKHTKEALQLIAEVGAPNLKLQYDVYHMQKMEGNLTETIKANLDRIAHVQIADNPGRHQPGTGEINYGFLLPELDNLGYQGFVGLEYIPAPDTLTSLAWIEKLGLEL